MKKIIIGRIVENHTVSTNVYLDYVKAIEYKIRSSYG